VEPPFRITPRVLDEICRVERLLGRLEGLRASRPEPLLRKRNRVRTVHASVAIEGNPLSREQATAVLEGRTVVAPPAALREIQNANRAYESAASYDASSRRDLLLAHGIMMKGLAPDAGRFRTGNVGVLRGDRVAHVAPQSSRVPGLVDDLLAWAEQTTTHRLVRSSVLHYELQFIHPFSDGNGRTGRFWQHVALLELREVFAFVPFESVIRARQRDYYDVLGESDRAGDSTPFLEFSMGAVREALEELAGQARPEPTTSATRLASARTALGRRWFGRKEYLGVNTVNAALSTATASRDLDAGAAQGLLEKRGERRLTEYRFLRGSRG